MKLTQENVDHLRACVCGFAKDRLAVQSVEDGFYFIQCLACGLTGEPMRPTLEGCIANWNYWTDMRTRERRKKSTDA